MEGTLIFADASGIRLIKRSAIVGRLYYHTAQCLLAQINPLLPKDSEESRVVQKHHAHQVCGIVAHTNDRGVASVSIRSLAIVAEVLTDMGEQREVISILEKIDQETGWKLGAVIKNLKRVWGWEKMGGTGLAAQFLAQGQTQGSMPGPGRQGSISGPVRKESVSGQGRHGSISGSSLGSGVVLGHVQNQGHGQGHGQSHGQLHGQSQQLQQRSSPLETTSPPGSKMPGMERAQQTVAAPRPMRNVNPLSFADFSLPNHPYQNWYEPPSRSSAYNSSQGLL